MMQYFPKKVLISLGIEPRAYIGSLHTTGFRENDLLKSEFLLILDIYFLKDNCSYASRTQVARHTDLV